MLRFASWAMLVVCCCGGLGFAEDPANPVDALETKLHAKWRGLGPCDGTLILNADGTYKRERFGPAGETTHGTWKLRWNALPPTLALHELEAADGVEVDTTWNVHKLNDQDLVIQFAVKSQSDGPSPSVYRRDSETP